MDESGKSPGQDGLSKELFESHWDLLVGNVMDFIRSFEITTELSQPTKTAVTVPLYKKGQTQCLPNYRPISLLNTVYKVIAKVLANRTRPVIHKVISDEQYGFISERRLADAVATVADVIVAENRGKEDWLLLLVDFQKAYDSVLRGYLFRSMRRMGFPNLYVRWVEGLHEGAVTRICMNGRLGELVGMRKGG
ncbi:hypothetical protein CLOM_g5819 [Closterium sp. NIES-68]|nr:hypothetical protein CLOM_g5819 [Closterium sp. NIES-68]GJP73878.1 hypothetical protein CLOP_g4550 [Closterium sp. NIES-67]